MKNILTLVLNKLGKNYEELKPVEKATFDRWESILTTSEITIEKLREFLEGEKEALIKELATSQYELDSKSDMFLKARLNDCLIILALLESPQKAKEQLEGYLKKLHKIK
jgi:hypothetical protein